MEEVYLGEVVDYFRKVGVMALQLEGTIRVGDRVRIVGHTTDLEQEISSMQIEHESVAEAGPGDLVGIMTSDRVRKGDKVYRLEG